MTDNLEQLESTQDSAPTSPESNNESASETVRETLNRVLAGQEISETEEEVEPLPEPPEHQEAAEETDEEVAETEVEEKAEDEPLEAIAPPQHWPNDFKEQFEKMDATGQHLFMKRYKDLEGDYTKKTQSLAKYRKRQESFDEIMKPHMDDFSRAGMDEVGAIRQLLSAHNYLKTDPKQAIQWLAKNYGVDISEVGVDSTEEDDYSDPQVKALQQQVAQLQGFLNQQQQTQMQSVQHNTQSMIDQFANEKNTDGSPKHPHFDNVRDRMGVLIQSNQAPDLATAYEMSIYSDPKLRQEMMDSYAANKTQKEVKTQAVAKAKKAQRSTVRGNAAPAEKALPGNMSVRDTIMKSIQQLENNERV
jgi:hypothetical protein